MSRKVSVGVLLGCAAVLAAVVAGYAGSARSATSGVQALPSSSCGPVIYKGSGSPDFIIPSDLPLAGRDPRPDRADLAGDALGARAGRLEGRPVQDRLPVVRRLDRTGRRAGTRASAPRTPASTRSDKSVIGVLGTFNSGCAKIEVPIMNRANPGPLGMVSPANTNPGLTKKWDPGEPKQVLPDRGAQLRTRRRHRRLPGPGRRDVDEGSRLQEGLRPQRQADVRLRRRHDVPEGGEEARADRHRLQGLGREAVELRGACQLDQGIGCAGRLPRRDHLQQRREADAGHQGRCSQHQAADARRLQRSGLERRGRQRRVHQRRRPAAEEPDGRRCDLRQELRQADRHAAEPVLRVRRAGDGRHAQGNRQRAAASGRRRRRRCSG